MDAVFAGVICSYGLALAATPLFALALVRARMTSPTVRRVMPDGTSLIAASVILHTFLLVTFTAAGMLLGMLLHGLESNSPDAGLGSPNRVFTILIIAATAIAVLPIAVVLPRWRLGLLAGGLTFAGVFGWLMPYLATWAPS